MKISKKRKKIINNKTKLKYGSNNIRKNIIDILGNNKNYLKLFLMLENKINSNSIISNELINDVLNLSNKKLSNKDYDNIRLIIKKNNKKNNKKLLDELQNKKYQLGGSIINSIIGIGVFTIIVSLIYKYNNKKKKEHNNILIEEEERKKYEEKLKKYHEERNKKIDALMLKTEEQSIYDQEYWKSFTEYNPNATVNHMKTQISIAGLSYNDCYENTDLRERYHNAVNQVKGLNEGSIRNLIENSIKRDKNYLRPVFGIPKGKKLEDYYIRKNSRLN